MNSALRHLTHSIYVLSGEYRKVRPWIGVVLTTAGTVLIDSGNGELHTAQLKAALASVNAPPVTHILITHHHWDHVFGNCYFPDATIIAHEGTQYHLNVMAGEPWSAEYNVEKAGESRRMQGIAASMNAAIPNWTEFHAVPAHETFTTTYDLEVGEYSFHMEHIGGMHATDHCVIRVQPGNVLFIGDAPYGSVLGNSDLAALHKEHEAILAFNAEWYVEGHRRPLPASTYQAMLLSGEPE